jgi:hypothetical protein
LLGRSGEACDGRGRLADNGRHTGLIVIAPDGVIMAPANRHDSPLLGETLDAPGDCQLDLSPEARQQLETEKIDLGSARAPDDVGEVQAAAIEQAVDQAFVSGFRTIMLVAAGMSLAGALWTLQAVGQSL